MTFYKRMIECQPDKPVVTFAGDSDDKGAYIDINIEGIVDVVQYV